MILLYFRYIRDNWLKTVFLFFLSSILCSLGLYCINHYIGFNQRLNVYRYYGLDKEILYTPGYGIHSLDVTDERAGEILEQINLLDEVERAEYLYRSTSVFLDDMSSDYERYKRPGMYVIPLCESEKEFPWEIIKGEVPEETNELLISSNFMGLYDVGDEITFRINAVNSKGELNRSEGVFKITGFFDEDSYMPPTNESSFRSELADFGGVTAYAFAKRIDAYDGTQISFRPSYDHIKVTPRNYFDIAKLKNTIPEIIGRGEAYDFSHYVELCYNDNKDMNDMINVLFVAMAVLTLSVLVSYTIIQLSVLRKEMVVYYLEGSTWKSVIGMSCFATLPVMILGMIAGILMYRYYPIFMSVGNGSYIFTAKAIIIFCSSVIAVYFLLCGLFYLHVLRQSPIEIIRSE